LRQRGNHLRKRSIVTEGLADVSEVIHISRPEDKGPAQLEGVLPQLVLTMSGGLGPLARRGIIAPQEMEDVGLVQAESAIGSALLVDKQWEVNAGFSAKRARVFHPTKADGDNARTPRRDLLFMRAQLRDVLTAEDSTPVTQEGNDG